MSRYVAIQTRLEYDRPWTYFEFNPRGHEDFLWLQKLCFWILRKCGCERQYRPVARQTHVEINYDSILAYIRRVSDLSRYDHRTVPKYALLGRPAMMKLWGEMSHHMGPEQIHIQRAWMTEVSRNGGKRLERSVYGLTVICLPWLADECIILPDIGDGPAKPTSRSDVEWGPGDASHQF